jgi:SAM-dependent methyltransferase
MPESLLKALRYRIKADFWKRRGNIPGAVGSQAAKWLAIEAGIARRDSAYGYDAAGLDERVVEYLWIFDRVAALDRPGGHVLDAGSVLNHKRVLDAWRAARFSPVSIVTLAHEGSAHVSNDVRYEFADLRRLPYRDDWFSVILCISTLEHVGLDTTIYGAPAGGGRSDPNAEAVRALRELRRVCAPGGTLLLSVPFGQRSNRNWLRILDGEDLDLITADSGWMDVRSRFFRATKDGWRESSREAAKDGGYNEPGHRPGQRTAPAFVAAAEAVALIELKRP